MSFSFCEPFVLYSRAGCLFVYLVYVSVYSKSVFSWRIELLKCTSPEIKVCRLSSEILVNMRCYSNLTVACVRNEKPRLSPTTAYDKTRRKHLWYLIKLFQDFPYLCFVKRTVAVSRHTGTGAFCASQAATGPWKATTTPVLPPCS